MAAELLKSLERVEVTLKKNSRGIGMRVCGGVDVHSGNVMDKLIRVKYLFPREPAMESGLIDVGDIIIEANGQSMVGISSIESLNILHSTKDLVTLHILKSKSLPCPDRSVSSSSLTLSPDPSIRLPYVVELTLHKKDGSLGFTIAKIDHEGFFVKELTKEPAILESRISPFDKIVRVNGVDLSPMTRNEAISYLRSLPDEVHLTLEKSGRPDSPTTEDEKEQRKKQLRHEARMMITDKGRTETIDRLKNRRDRRRTRDCNPES